MSLGKVFDAFGPPRSASFRPDALASTGRADADRGRDGPTAGQAEGRCVFAQAGDVGNLLSTATATASSSTPIPAKCIASRRGASCHEPARAGCGALRERELATGRVRYLDDPEDMERLRRRKLGDYRLLPPPVDEYDDADDALRANRSSDASFPPAPGRPHCPSSGPSRASSNASRSRSRLDGDPSDAARRRDRRRSGRRRPPMSFTAREDVAGMQVLLDRDGRFAGRHRRQVRLECRQGACRLPRDHRQRAAVDRHGGHQGGAGRDGGDAFTDYTITAGGRGRAVRRLGSGRLRRARPSSSGCPSPRSRRCWPNASTWTRPI